MMYTPITFLELGLDRTLRNRIRAFQEDQFVSFGFGTHDWHCGVTDLRCGPAHVLAGKCQWRKGLCILPGTGHGFWDTDSEGLGWLLHWPRPSQKHLYVDFRPVIR